MNCHRPSFDTLWFGCIAFCLTIVCWPLLCINEISASSNSKYNVTVNCRQRWMDIRIQVPPSYAVYKDKDRDRDGNGESQRDADHQNVSTYQTQILSVHLEGFGRLPHCVPQLTHNHTYVFHLSLDRPEMACGLIREIDYDLNEQRFKHRVLIHSLIQTNLNSNHNSIISDVKQRMIDAIQVRCVGLWIAGNHNNTERFRRSATDPLIRINQSSPPSASPLSSEWNELPPDFTESSDELLDYSGNVTANGPRPEVRIAVRQSGRRVDGGAVDEQLGKILQPVTVQPGTPLELTIHLQGDSTDVYGLLCSQLKVADRPQSPAQEEPLLANGCSMDPYLFGNFESIDHGKSISARFRAFKFPESNFVLFVSRVQVCLNTCQPVRCEGDNRKSIYGRKRRKRSTSQPAFEVQMSTIIQVQSLKQTGALIGSEYHGLDGKGLRKKVTNSALIHQMPLVNRCDCWPTLHLGLLAANLCLWFVHMLM